MTACHCTCLVVCVNAFRVQQHLRGINKHAAAGLIGIVGSLIATSLPGCCLVRLLLLGLSAAAWSVCCWPAQQAKPCDSNHMLPQQRAYHVVLPACIVQASLWGGPHPEAFGAGACGGAYLEAPGRLQELIQDEAFALHFGHASTTQMQGVGYDHQHTCVTVASCGQQHGSHAAEQRSQVDYRPLASCCDFMDRQVNTGRWFGCCR